MKSFKLASINLFVIILIGSILLANCKNKKNEEKPKPQVTDKVVNREKPKLIYDAKGNITERHANSYRSDNSIRAIDSYYYKYDDRNNVTEESKESFTPEGELVFKNVNFYTYNDLNQKTEQKFFSYDKNNVLQRQARNTYKYNAKGDLVEEKTYFENGAVKSIINTERNELGELKSEEYIHFNQDGTKIDHKKYHYTKYGLERTEDLMK
jgi:hypothetical protein